MMKKIYRLTGILVVVLMTTTSVFAQKLLIINKVADNPADSKLMEYLELQGWTCTFVLSDDFLVADGSYSKADGYAGYDAIFFGEELGSGDIHNFHVAGYPLPCVNTEGWAYRSGDGKWGWLSDNDNQFKQLTADDSPSAAEANTLVFSGDTETWLGSQYEEGHELLWTSLAEAAVGSNGIAFDEDVPEAVAIASLLSPALEGKPVLWAIPAGTEIITDPNGEAVSVTIEYPMVYLALIHDGQVEGTNEFHELVLNSLKWVTGDTEPGTPTINIVTNGLKVWPNPASGLICIANAEPGANISVLNMVGKEVITTVVNNVNMDLNLANLNTGVYFIKVGDAVQKIVVK